MKKVNLWLIASLFTATCVMTACGSDDEENGKSATSPDLPTTASDLIGTWSNDGKTFAFTNDALTITYSYFDGREERKTTYQGKYTYAGDKLTYVCKSDTIVEQGNATVRFLYNKQTLVLKTVPDFADDYSLDVVPMVLFKNGNAPETPVADIQGKWYFYMQGDHSYVRTGVTFTGDKVEMIITPWAQRYVGTYTYSKGIVKFKFTEFYSARGENGYGFGEGNLNPETLECDYWWTCTADDLAAPEEMEFIAGSDEAYGYIVGLPAIFEKQK